MFKHFKKPAVLFFMLAVLLVCAACGANNTGTAATDTSTSSPSAAVVESASPQASEAAAPVENAALTISAAASLTDALQEIKQAYEAANPSISLNFNFGASGALQQQIEQGAPADLFLSASSKNLKALVEGGFIAEDQQKKLLANELVIVTGADSKVQVAAIADLSQDTLGKIAIGIPESVPAGNYAMEALTNAKLWDSLQSKLVQAKDVRQVLQYVETGNVDAGFVYRTDALTSDKVTIAAAVDPATYTPIVYPIGIVKETKHQSEAEAFYAYLQTADAMNVFTKYGFSAAQ